MLNKSTLYTLLDNKNNSIIYLLEGQQLIADLAVVHNLQNQTFMYLRDLVLSFQTMLAFLKNNESLGLYLDSQEPKFNFKIELGHTGSVRSLLLPPNFDDIPNKINGICRLVKTLSSGKQYNSVINLEQLTIKQIVSSIIKNSYQIEAQTVISEEYDISALITKLPNSSSDAFKKSLNNSVFLKDLFKLALDSNINEGSISDLDLTLLGQKNITYTCTCSKERIISALASITDQEEIFKEDQTLEVKCDYCKKTYSITKEDIN